MAGLLTRLLLAGAIVVAAVFGAPAIALAQREDAALRRLDAEFMTLFSAGRYDEALASAEQAVAAARQLFGAEHVRVTPYLNRLAAVHHTRGRLVEAEQLHRQALAIREKALGPSHIETAQTLNNLGSLLEQLGQYTEAEVMLRRALTIRERVHGTTHESLAQPLNNLAAVYEARGRREDAIRFNLRALEIREKAFGPDHPDVAQSLSNLAISFRHLGALDRAEELYRRSLAVYEQALGREHPYVAEVLNNLAILEETRGNYAAAVPHHRRNLAIVEKTFGAEHASVAMALGNLAVSHRLLGDLEESERLHRRGLAIREKVYGGEHPTVAHSLGNLAALAFLRQSWSDAAASWRRSSAIFKRRVIRDQRAGVASFSEVKGGGDMSPKEQFAGLARALHHLGAAGATPGLRDEAFEATQWALFSDAAASLALSSARAAALGPQLAGLARERQDLSLAWQKLDARIVLAVSGGGEPVAAIDAEMRDIDRRIAELDRRLAVEFPEYSELAAFTPIGIAEARQLLRPDEALVVLLDTPRWSASIPGETMVWVLTRSGVSWTRSSIGTQELAQAVATLRCGLDATAWTAVGASACAELPGRPPVTPGAAPSPLPFDVAAAHRLYRGLFGDVDADLRGKHLLIVPTGPLTALPFHVLVTEEPGTGASLEGAAWLGVRQPLTVLPAVSSLKSLRKASRASAATRPFIGFGNPLLVGGKGTDRSAWDRQTCGRPPTPLATGAAPKLAHAAPAGQASLVRGGLADVEALRMQEPLPETADELCAVARALGIADPDGIVHLGARASETRVKALSADGTLESARVVHLATHGLVAGETARIARTGGEPALVLTPPPAASEHDDGLLTASEVAGLKLDADWVVLSACNTAAGDRGTGDALSGLARAFFYAGARALLVSHWYVDSDATVKLVTGAFEALAREPGIGRAEAMRRAMQGLIRGGGVLAHPASWAPFVVVGEGGAG